MVKKILTTVMTICATLAFCTVTSSAEEVAGKAWPATAHVSMDQIDHAPFDRLLKKYVNDDGEVNYKAWHRSQSDRAALTVYLESLGQASAGIAANKNSQFAYWINAYNAVTIEGILRVYPTTSIRKHTKAIGYNLWKDLYLISGTQKISLDSMEHKVLRKMGDPRVHFAIVCASIGCPRLLNEAYVADRLEEQLVTNTKDFFSRDQNLQVSNGNLKLSEILSWFGSDFGRSQQEQFAFLRTYLPVEAQRVVDRGRFRVSYLKYDWGLNTQ